MAGCPPGKDRTDRDSTGGVPDEYDEYTKLISSLNGVQDELKRLQGLFTAPAQLGGQAQPPDYEISFETSTAGIDLVLAGNVPEDTWRLAVWSDEGGGQVPAVIRDEAEPGGHHFEATVGGALTLSLNLSWQAGGGVLIRRSLLLGGLDLTYEFTEGACDWVLSGPWLPYRLLPQPDGPWGVAREADGEWHSAVYPGACWLPAVAAYDGRRGWLLGIADEHARKLDRNYQPAWRIDPDYDSGEALRIRTACYDSTRDGYYPGSLVSGLEQRDALALYTMAFTQACADHTSVEAQSTQVIEAMARYVREQHYCAQPPPHCMAGNITYLSDKLVEDMPEEFSYAFERFLTQAEVGCLLLNQKDLSNGALSNKLAATLKGLGIQVVETAPDDAAASKLEEPRDPDQAAAWLRTLSRGNAEGSGQETQNEASGIGAAIQNTTTDGWCWNFYNALNYEGETDGQGAGFPMPPALSFSVLALHAVENVRLPDKDAVLLVRGYPALCLPGFADAYIAPGGLFGGQEEASRGGAFDPLAERLANRLAAIAFSANVIADSPDGSLAGLVLAADGHQAGLCYNPGLKLSDGFNALCRNSAGLANWGQQLRYIYSEPVSCSYSLEGERPAVCTAMIGLIPADLIGADSVWIVFAGIGGSVTVDYRNNLFVNWQAGGGEQAWSTRLPVGYWKVDHPNPGNVSPGDAVLVRKETLSPGAQPGTGTGT